MHWKNWAPTLQFREAGHKANTAPWVAVALAIAATLALARAVSAQVPALPSETDTSAVVARPSPDSATLASAYLDVGAREMVRLARERRRVVDRSIESYETTASERVSIGLRALRRDRVLFQREVASRVSWQRDGPVRIEVLGAREVLPILIPNAQVPGDLEQYLPRLVFDPADPFLVTGWGDADDDIAHPLAPGSEVDYRFRSGDTTVIRLPDGRDVRLLELELLPRRKAGNLVQGSFWLDEATHAVVRAIFRLADVYTEAGDAGGPSLEVEYITIEYGLWDSQWWLPRIFALRGVGRLGSIASGPLLYELKYADYVVRGVPGSAALLDLDESPYAPGTRTTCPGRASITIQIGWGSAPAPDSTEAPAQVGVVDDSRLSEAERRACERIEVVLPADTDSLLTSSALSASSPFASGEGLLTPAELRSIESQLAELGLSPWSLARPRITSPLSGLGLARYNRVEGLSLGLRADMDLGRLQASAMARIGVADLQPNAELTLARDKVPARLQLRAYRDLVAMDPESRPFSPGSSISSLLLGRDEADYYRSLGVDLTGEPSISRPRWYDWRLYAQRESAAEKETDFSLPHLLDESRHFPDNAPADPATQYGAALHLRGGWGNDPLGFRTNAELGLDGAVGTFGYARPSLTLRAGFPLPGPFVGQLEGASGTSFGDLGRQHLWRIGGPTTLRGYASGVLAGESFWRGRVEVATQLPAVRLILFSDAGWAGSLDRIDSDPWLLSAGAGISLLDGLVRVDLARATNASTGWRLTAYLDAWQ